MIAYYKGGAAEIIDNNQNGILIKKQDKEDVKEAVLQLEKDYMNYNSDEIRERALKYNEDNFDNQIQDFIKEKMKENNNNNNIKEE